MKVKKKILILKLFIKGYRNNFATVHFSPKYYEVYLEGSGFE